MKCFVFGIFVGVVENDDLVGLEIFVLFNDCLLCEKGDMIVICKFENVFGMIDVFEG